ncbi:hypothetical protein N799_04120 [Lysobacter arseniciresistens ZS79]|uniref:CBS domain-containing protein n=1 Tax=Lysobacter arseniciresistens ZS79 TaxID=913325 RepID=A0A0A0F0Z4_9GAMM|nr:hypothetical protein N799_04120 [Lysobacter arseniciresistens ZS79]
MAEPLRSAPAQALATQMADELRLLDFDVVGVKRVQRGRVVGYVRREDLISGIVADHLRPIDADLIVGSDLAVPALLDRLSRHDMVFIGASGTVTGIVTRADLNKPLVRSYLFGLISLLEFHLGYWVSVDYPDDTWKAKLTTARLEATQERQRERTRRGQPLPLLQCLEIGDKHTLIVKSAPLRALLGFASRNQAEDVLGDAEHLRNNLAHSQYDLVSGRSWSELITLVQRIEQIIGTSDLEVERRAQQLATIDLGALW